MNEPAWKTFAVIGMMDPGSARMIESAVRSVDPAARVAVSLAAGLASVQSVAPVALICQAIESQGFIAEPSTRAFPLRHERSTPPASGRAILRVLGRALLWGLLCALVAPLITFVAVLGLQYFDHACGTPGDSGGCAMGLVSATILSIAPGAVIGFLIALAHGIVQIANASAES
jgi:hypothetical protein